MSQEGRPSEPAREWLWAGLVALVFGRGLFAHLDKLGTGDWDYFVSHAQAAYTSLVSYGQVPLWTPHHCGGAALFENFQSRVYSPSFLLVLAFGADLGCRLTMLLSLLLGFEGTRRLACALGAGPWASRLAALATVGNGAVLAQVAVGHFGSMPYLLWPWWLLALRTAETRPAAGSLAGGAWLALSYVEAGIYPIVHGLVWIFVWTLSRALRTKSLVPVLALARVGAVSALLSASVLVPSALHLAKNPRGQVVPEVVSLTGLRQMLLSTDFDFQHAFRFAGQRWGWHEYAAYLGPLFLAGLLFALVRVRSDPRLAGWLLSGLFFTLWVLGDFAPWSPWNLAHHLPVLRSMRASGRAMIPAIFCFSLAIALALSRIEHLRGVVPALTLALGINLAWVTPGALDKVFVLERKVERDPTFTQRAATHHYRLMGTRNYSLMTLDVLSNRGALKCYEPTRVPRGARALWPAGDEVWLAPEGGRARITSWSPQELVVSLPPLEAPQLLFLNQNFHSGWSRDDDVPVVNQNNLLATPVQPGKREVRLRFEAPLMRGLLSVSLIGLLALLLWLRRENERSGSQEPARGPA